MVDSCNNILRHGKGKGLNICGGNVSIRRFTWCVRAIKRIWVDGNLSDVIVWTDICKKLVVACVFLLVTAVL